jgi:hypothetical protein
MRPTRLSIDGVRFRDEQGRQVLLRGVNLGGDSKTPAAPDGRTHRPTDFSDHRTVSFVGRPFPLEDADTHLRRIAGWGFNCLRLLTTWEAVEHAGPGEYDEAYLDYFAEVCRKAGDHGLRLFVDFHQDVWSRMSGGDGAPGWTFEAVGLDFTRFDAADAAHVMQHRYRPGAGAVQDSYPQMSWAGNYRMPANGIMWTLFFAGQDFAPGAQVDGVNTGVWLRQRYLGAMRALAERVADLDHVIGFDTLNEPGSGWIGRGLEDRSGALKGEAWSPLDGLAAASGHPRTLPVVEFGRGVTGERVVNPNGVSVWLPGREDPFRGAGAWDVDAGGRPQALRPDHFRVVDGRAVSAEADYMGPFFREVAETVRAIRPDWLIFAEVDPFAALRGDHGFPENMPERTVNASHWYDLAALVTKRYDPERSLDLLSGTVLEGREAITGAYVAGLERIKALGERLNGGAPTLIGEFGIPYDLNDRDAYDRWAAGERNQGVFAVHAEALSRMYDALDRLLLNSTQWNYTVANENDVAIGDGWNQEDLSIWSADQATSAEDPDSGGRGIAGFRRPLATAVQGAIVSQSFDRDAGVYRLVFEADAALDAASEVSIPAGLYAQGWVAEVEPAVESSRTPLGLRFQAAASGRHALTVRPA